MTELQQPGRYREILVHVGMSKTGTTSIQETCRKHRDKLRQSGVYYPVFSSGSHRFLSHSIPLTVAVCAAPGQYGLGLQRRFGEAADRVKGHCREQFADLLAKGGDGCLLLSSELVESWQPDDLERLRQRLLPHAGRLRVLLYVRSPESALESVLQERAKAGAVLDPAVIVGRVKRKYLRLEAAFGSELEVVDYHSAQQEPGGLVGSFLTRCGLSGTELSGIYSRTENRRLSVEAYRLITAVNARFPASAQADHGVGRHPRDLDVLATMPGQPFRLTGFAGSEVHNRVLEETRWMESRLGFTFPRCEPEQDAGQLWAPPAVSAAERLVPELGSGPLRRYIAQYMREEGRRLAAPDPHAASRLAAAAQRIEESERDRQ